MKLIEIKKLVFNILDIDNTKQLKNIRPDLVKNLDLRTKFAWQKIELVITEEINFHFQQVLLEATEANKQSNHIIQNSLINWEDFKNKAIAESQAEVDNKLSHLSDYQTSQNLHRQNNHNKKSTNSNIINFKK